MVASQRPVQPLEPFAEIVRRYQAAVCATAYGVTGDRALAEDIAQETFLVAWRTRSTLRDNAKIGAWLRGIARNLACKARRKRATIALDDHPEIAAGDDPAQDAVAGDETRLAWAALRELPPPYREALVLYYWGDQSAKQIAELLGITEATAMQRLSRGRAQLRVKIVGRIERTLRRARPGAALTAAILAAVAAATTDPAPAAAGTRAPPPPRRGVSRRVLGQAGLTFVALRILGGAAPIAVRAGRRSSGSPRAAPAAAERVSPGDPGDVPDTAVAAEPPDPPAPPAEAGEAGALDDVPNPYEESMSSVITSSDAPAGWAGKLHAALWPCFVDELVDRPCRIDVEVREGKIAAATVAPFEGASHRVVVRTLGDASATLAPPDLIAWLAADQLIHVVRNAPELADRDRAMQVGELLGLCTRTRLVGLPVAGPNGVRRLWLGWKRDPVAPIDWQAYRDLGVAEGPSLGPASAPVTVVSFLDIAGGWGFGGKSLAAWREALASHPRDARLVVKLCPLNAEHALAAQAVHAAGAQSAFWPMLERVAASPDHRGLDDLVGHATTLGLDPSRFRADLEGEAYRGAVELDGDQMTAMDIDRLPSAIVNDKRFWGALPAAACADAISRALRRLAR